MFGLTSLGVVHTAISLVAVVAGVIALVRDQRIAPRGTLGQVYVITTALTCLTGFGIFQHGGFGKPHMLGIITLVVLAAVLLASRFGRAAPYVETLGMSATFLFHMIPAFTETLTRLPLGAPVFPNAEAPGLQPITGALVVLFVGGAAWQVRKLRRGSLAAVPA